jgi:hypothetical protein
MFQLHPEGGQPPRGKVDSSCEKMVYAEAASVLPLLAIYARHRGSGRNANPGGLRNSSRTEKPSPIKRLTN